VALSIQVNSWKYGVTDTGYAERLGIQ